MAKTPKSELKEIADRYRGFKFEVFESTDANLLAILRKEFQFTCRIKKSDDERYLEGKERNMNCIAFKRY